MERGVGAVVDARHQKGRHIPVVGADAQAPEIAAEVDARSPTFYGSATVGTKGQIVIPADARRAMGVKAGDRVVVVRGPRDDTISVIGVEAFERLLARVAELDEHAPE